MFGGKALPRLAIGLVVFAGCGGGSEAPEGGAVVTAGESGGTVAADVDNDVDTTSHDDVWDNGLVELRVGDCYRALPRAADDEGLNAEVVPCTDPHDAEVVSVSCAESGMTESDPDASARIAADLYASYVGLESSDGTTLTDWLTEAGVATRGAWDAQAGGGCLSYLASDGVDLTESFRSSVDS